MPPVMTSTSMPPDRYAGLFLKQGNDGVDLALGSGGVDYQFVAAGGLLGACIGAGVWSRGGVIRRGVAAAAGQQAEGEYSCQQE